MYSYFVSYASESKHFGMMEIKSPKKVKSFSDVLEFRELICKEIGEEVVIINWELLGE